jgi:hypothetical protein
VTIQPFEKSPMQKIVLGLMGVALVIVAFTLAGVVWGLFLTLLLGLEAYALLNDYSDDTISEVLWRLSKRPIVPWLFGLATGWAITSKWIFGYLDVPPTIMKGVWLILAVGFLQGHFWFQEKRSGS